MLHYSENVIECYRIEDGKRLKIAYYVAQSSEVGYLPECFWNNLNYKLNAFG